MAVVLRRDCPDFFRLAIISKLVLVTSIAVFIGGFLHFNCFFFIASSLKLLMGSSWPRFIFENSLIMAFALRSGVEFLLMFGASEWKSILLYPLLVSW